MERTAPARAPSGEGLAAIASVAMLLFVSGAAKIGYEFWAIAASALLWSVFRGAKLAVRLSQLWSATPSGRADPPPQEIRPAAEAIRSANAA